MTPPRVPVDSAEARELREAEEAREAERLARIKARTNTDQSAADEDQEPALLVAHDPRCQRGWLGFDDEERPIPCPHCRPHLVRLDDGRTVHRAVAERITYEQ